MVCTHDETIIFPVRDIDLAPFQHSIFSGRNSVCRKLFSFSLHRFSSFRTDAAESEPAGPRYPFLTRRPCSLLPAEVIMEGYDGCLRPADPLSGRPLLFVRSFPQLLPGTVKRQWPIELRHFFIQDDVPQQAPETARLIHRYGDGFYKEEIFFFQRMEKCPEG